MIGVAGRRSSIVKEFLKNNNEMEVVRPLGALPLNCDNYLICTGVLHGLNMSEMEYSKIAETFFINFTRVVKFCEALFEVNESARVCVIGSESGFKGSYDMAYAGAKAALHLYIETKRLGGEQHLVCVAPTIIEDSGMTQRRDDLDETLKRGEARRLGRWLNAAEVARICKFALDEDALCNTVIRATGGNW